MVWVMFIAFARLVSVVTLFVRDHDLRKENEGAVLRVVRVTGDRRGQDLGVEMQDVRDGEVQQ